MMKQRIIACIVLLVFSSSLFADTTTSLYGIFFPGIKTNYSVPGESTSKNTASVAMEQQLKDAYTLFGNYQQQVVIGHSQGGFRALGYANYLKEKGEADKLKAVISIGAPARGFTPLIKGKDDLSRRIDDKVKATINGINSCFSVFGVVNAVSAWPFLGALNTTLQGLYQFVFPFFLNGFKYNDWASPSSVKMMMNVLGDVVSNDVMRDFTPGSDYIRNRIAPTYIPAQGHYVKIKVGKILWFDIYKTIWVMDKPAQMEYKMPPNLNVGFVVGEGNVKDMVLESIKNNESMYNLVNAFFSGMPPLMAISAELNIALAAVALSSALACPINWGAWAAVGYYSVQTSYALNALFIWTDFNNVFNRDILLTNSSDGFIPYAAQKWDPVTELGCKSISDKGSYVVYDVNHYTELEDDRIWGIGGDDYNPKENGKVHEWTYETTKKWFGSNYLMMMNH
jgi:hypothetical protein